MASWEPRGEECKLTADLFRQLERTGVNVGIEPECTVVLDCADVPDLQREGSLQWQQSLGIDPDGNLFIVTTAVSFAEPVADDFGVLGADSSRADQLEIIDPHLQLVGPQLAFAVGLQVGHQKE